MEAVAAIGLASSILTFVDFSSKVISGTSQIYKSGSTPENAHIGKMVEGLRDAAEALCRDTPDTGSRHEQALKTLAGDCHSLGQDLIRLLETVKSTGPKTPLWKEARLALRSVRMRDQIKELDERLSGYREQMILQLHMILR